MSQFLKALRERNVRGRSKRCVYDYLNGEVVPPLQFLEQAADILQVHPEWLVLGKPAPLGMFRLLPSPSQKYWRAVDQFEKEERRSVEVAVAHCLPLFRGMSNKVRDAVYDLFLKLESFNWSYRYCCIPTPYSAHDLDLAERLGRVLGAALTELSLNQIWVSKTKQERYVAMLCELVALLLPEEGEPSDKELLEIQNLFYLFEQAHGHHHPPHLKIIGTRPPFIPVSQTDR